MLSQNLGIEKGQKHEKTSYSYGDFQPGGFAAFGQRCHN